MDQSVLVCVQKHRSEISSFTGLLEFLNVTFKFVIVAVVLLGGGGGGLL